MTPFLHFSTYIHEKAEPLAVEVVDSVLNRMQLDIPDWEKEQAIAMYIELLKFFGESLMEEDKEAAPEALIKWSKKNAEMQISSDGEISEIVVRYPPTRDIFNEILTRISVELDLSLKENAYILKRINNMLDISLNETFFSFKRLSDKYKEDTQAELLKLSAPIVPIKDDIVILPLIGYIDKNRAEHIMDNVVPRIADMEVKHVIADFSGVLTINSQIALSLHQIGEMLRMMGVHVVTAGMRPELVQTVVSSNIELSGIESFANVKQALENIQ
ncbi:STAS domain-containing protein [Alteribacillus sp. YIM 98480]|uniref:STAS domain-containing protein n=1 Tax=Alteribacillus sp. YIM 98480 TaxID=2606599 RepID=UPI00131E66A2|nr:STAS domain-containing protein [Alteribacillus sp. YIM 98480]